MFGVNEHPQTRPVRLSGIGLMMWERGIEPALSPTTPEAELWALAIPPAGASFIRHDPRRQSLPLLCRLDEIERKLDRMMEELPR